MCCAQHVLRLIEFASPSPLSPSSTKHSTYLHVSAPTRGHQWSHMLVLVQITKSHSTVSDSELHPKESHLPQPHLKSNSPFLPLHLARTQQLLQFLLLITKLQQAISTDLRQPKVVMWSNLDGPEHPSTSEEGHLLPHFVGSVVCSVMPCCFQH